ncbi:MAG TPA: hypothetical protein VFW76_05960 [Ktedonobacterales bacterium]|nr:hypothetical protein [Ktedonobacterales bacterium]
MHTQDHLPVPRRLLLMVASSTILTLLTLAACGASTVSGPAAHATATTRAQTTATAAQATRAAQPVLLAMQVTQQGTLDQYNQSAVLSGKNLTTSMPFTLR